VGDGTACAPTPACVRRQVDIGLEADVAANALRADPGLPFLAVHPVVERQGRGRVEDSPELQRRRFNRFGHVTSPAFSWSIVRKKWESMKNVPLAISFQFGSAWRR
jgi:hypothetical protein